MDTDRGNPLWLKQGAFGEKHQPRVGKAKQEIPGWKQGLPYRLWRTLPGRAVQAFKYTGDER
jgi:hypothetical protein